MKSDPSNTYTASFPSKCPTDTSVVTHTMICRKSEDPSNEDEIVDFKCSRDSKCIKCRFNYL